MNIIEYRKMVTEEKNRSATQQTAPTETKPTEPQATQTQPPEQKSTEQTTPTQDTKPTKQQPQKFVVDGEEFTPEQIKEFKKGYLRQDDYTRKTQALAAQRREAEQAIEVVRNITSNPELLGQLTQQVPGLDPNVRHQSELEAKLMEARVENEVLNLSQKYPDFDVREAMQIAVDRKLNSLEDAYIIGKTLKQSSQQAQQQTQTPPQVQAPDDLIKTITEAVMKQLKPEPNTSSMISTQQSNAPMQDNAPKLSEAQLKAARAFGMTPEEYVKWGNPR